ncbi:hypothetical protein BGZ96_011323 [Linnemannia gamsii]|uniref:Uncharacterized protein n=1 Tax=Linnemannia gamsii TaxID=64522 RepID=A0ABQ7KE83_9FUNG|nr:hypothetical protein BGZ96_011323 [Linnemannia gamsii]
MKVASVIILSAIAAIACASHSTSKSQVQQPDRELYARNRFAQRRDLLGGVLPIGQIADVSTNAPKSKTVDSGISDLLKRSSDIECKDEDEDEDEDDGHESHHNPHHHNPHHHNPPHHGHHGHPKPPHHGSHGSDHHSGGSDGDGIHIGLDTIINAKIDVILKAYLGILLDVCVDIKADILAKIALKLGLDLKVDLGLALKIKAIVDAKIDALINLKLKVDIRAKIDALVHHRCTSTCGSDVDLGILADITAAVKLDLGILLADIDADILADIKVNLDALGLKVKADVDLALGLNLGAILGGLVGDIKDSEPGILADIKLAVLANL